MSNPVNVAQVSDSAITHHVQRDHPPFLVGHLNERLGQIVGNVRLPGRIDVGGGVGGVGAIGGSKEILELIDIRPDDPEWNRSKRIFHSGTFNGNPLCAAAGIATLKRLATGEPQKTADERAAGIREGCGKVLEDRGVDGCTYGECSSFHLYIGPCPIREECNKSVCLYHEKVYEHHLYTELHRNMLFNGVDLVGAPPLFGTTCEMHTEEDIEKTVAAFADSLDRMKAEGILK